MPVDRIRIDSRRSSAALIAIMSGARYRSLEVAAYCPGLCVSTACVPASDSKRNAHGLAVGFEELSATLSQGCMQSRLRIAICKR